jgi:hypothetical protein
MTDPLLGIACSDEERRLAVADATLGFNGIDWIEVDPADQKILHIGFLHPLPGQPAGIPGGAAPVLGPGNVTIEGGERIRNVAVLSVVSSGRELTVTTDRAGDFSPYVLRLLRSPTDRRAPGGFDPVLSAIRFSFKAN